MALSDYQCSFNGLTIGDGTDYDLRKTVGLEAVDTRGTNVEFSAAWGSSAGPAYVNERYVTLSVDVDAVAGAAVRYALETAFAPGLTGALSAFNWKWPGREELTAQARVTRWGRPHQFETELPGISPYEIELVFPDPRKYSAAVTSQALGTYAAISGGLELTSGSGVDLGLELTVSSGADLGLDMAASSGVGDFNCVNSGNTATYPVITFTTTVGVSSYRLSNLTNGLSITVTQPLSPSEQLVANMRYAVTGSGSPILYQGVNRYSTWLSPRVPFYLSPGTNVLRFEVLSGSASSTCTVQWQNAYV